MKAIFTFFACLAVTVLAATTPQSKNTSEIQWLTNYDDAVKESTATSKYILMLFTGSDWCPWCQKLDKEVMSSPEFAEAVGSKFVFLKVDFPAHTKLSSTQLKHNTDLKEKFGVKGFPTLIILDEKQQKIATVGYRQGGAKAYAEFLESTVTEYNGYNKKLHATMSAPTSSEELKNVYETACRLGQDDDKPQLITAGEKSENPVFFLKEQYRALVESGKITSKEAQAVREQLLNADPSNTSQANLSVAVIDYQQLAKDMANGQCDASTACAPLISYIDHFGSQDKEHLWRMQMTVAETYLSQHDAVHALSYAQASYKNAPDVMRPQIANTIQQIEDTMTAAR